MWYLIFRKRVKNKYRMRFRNWREEIIKIMMIIIKQRIDTRLPTIMHHKIHTRSMRYIPLKRFIFSHQRCVSKRQKPSSELPWPTLTFQRDVKSQSKYLEIRSPSLHIAKGITLIARQRTSTQEAFCRGYYVRLTSVEINRCIKGEVNMALSWFVSVSPRALLESSDNLEIYCLWLGLSLFLIFSIT